VDAANDEVLELFVTPDTGTHIDHTARISASAKIGERTWVGQNVQIHDHAEVGEDCRIHKNVYLGTGARIGNRVKIQNDVSIFDGITLNDGVFVGPHVCFTNDKIPRAINPDGSIKQASDWKITETLVETGASIGANATIVCGVRIGAWAMVGSGAVVTRDVPSYGLVLGNPARLRGYVCECGLPKEEAVLANTGCRHA
jgi:acetyltransferase-like isoleucine patch superfamily enzyme